MVKLKRIDRLTINRRLWRDYLDRVRAYHDDEPRTALQQRAQHERDLERSECALESLIVANER